MQMPRAADQASPPTFAPHGACPPASYEAGGRQLIVLPTTGSGKLSGPSGDAWVALALSKE